jgi:hypothetical protein
MIQEWGNIAILFSFISFPCSQSLDNLVTSVALAARETHKSQNSKESEPSMQFQEDVTTPVAFLYLFLSSLH